MPDFDCASQLNHLPLIHLLARGLEGIKYILIIGVYFYAQNYLICHPRTPPLTRHPRACEAINR